MAHKIEIIPAILPKDFGELEEKVGLIQGLVKTVQVDICDGQFVPNATWPYRKHDDSFEKIVHEDEGLPAWEKLNYEFDLMVNHPEKVVDEWVQAGATRIIIHIESKGDVAGAVQSLAGRVDIGLALNIETSIEELQVPSYKLQEGNIQFVQLMGIDRIGFQAQEFDEKVIGRVKQVRLKYPGLPISIDGGVSLDNARQLIEAGADRLVVGSAIFESDNFIEALEKFKRLSK
ncbi:hypothetical protein EPO05_06310 [Patescibacteria group bacterium]|nr:MAG: hypothetical protein EPO05_06310 [Patescibacteria group bacterium]